MNKPGFIKKMFSGLADSLLDPDPDDLPANMQRVFDELKALRQENAELRRQLFELEKKTGKP